MKKNMLTFLLLFASYLTIAQSSSIDWLIQNEATGDAFGTSITTDDNFVYAAGVLTDTCYFGDTTLISKGSVDFYISKYDNEGKLMWVKQFGGSGYDRCNDIIYHNGHLYATGFFAGTLYFADTMLISAGSYDMFLLDMDVNGNINKMEKTGGTGEDQGYALCTDNEDNLYWTGIFQDMMMINGLEVISNGDFDLFTAKLNNEGELLWVNTAGGPEQDLGLALATDNYDNVYVTGSFEDTATFGESTISSLGNQDIFLVKYNSSGEQIWLQTAGGEWGAKASAITIDNDDQLFLTGLFGGDAFFGNDTIVSYGSFDVFLANYDFDGELQWVETYGSLEYDHSSDIIVDNDFVFLSCYFDGETVLKDTSLSDRSAQIMQFSKSGELLDLIQTGNYYHNKCTLDRSSALFVTGAITHTPSLFGDQVFSASSFGFDVFTARINYKHTGLEHFISPEAITIFPNPVHQTVYILYDQDAIVTLYNLNGQIIQQKLLQKETGKVTMDIFNLKPGMYIVTVQTESTVVSTKLIKK